MIRITGSMLYGNPMGKLEITLPMMTSNINGTIEIFGQLSITLPAKTLSSVGYISTEGTLQFALPKMIPEFSGAEDFKGDLNTYLPALRFNSTAIVNEVGTLSITLPSLKMRSGNSADATGSLAIEIPYFAIAFGGYSSVEGSLGITLPPLVVSFYSTSSDDTYESMVMNLKNQALTIYKNYNFNSMCQFNGVPLGATKTGIYNLNSGETDDGTVIDWNIKTGLIDLEQVVKHKLRQAWISYKTNGDILFTVILPDGTEYEYALKGIDNTENGLRVKFGKGIRSKYIALDIENINYSTFELDELKLHFQKTQQVR